MSTCKKRCSSACRHMMGSPKEVAPDLLTKNLLKMPKFGGIGAPAGAGSLAARLRQRQGLKMNLFEKQDDETRIKNIQQNS